MPGNSQGSAYPAINPPSPTDYFSGAAILERARESGRKTIARPAPTVVYPQVPRGHTFGTHVCATLSAAEVDALGGAERACAQRCRLRRNLPDGAYSAIPCWTGDSAWVQAVEDTYRSEYTAWIRAELWNVRRGGISLKALLSVSEVLADAAAPATGRRCIAPVDSIMRATGLSRTTVQKALMFFLVSGLATEVSAGVTRTRDERRAGWRTGDNSRGWARELALHPRRAAVDNQDTELAGHGDMAPPHTQGSKKHCGAAKRPHRCGSSWVTTAGAVDKKTKMTARKVRKKPRRASADLVSLRLAAAWLRCPNAPRWARTRSVNRWAPALVPIAQAGWTDEDLTLALNTWSRSKGIAIDPQEPIAWMRWWITQIDVTTPPAAKARADRAAADARRLAEQAARRAEQAEARRNAAPQNSPGRERARQIVAAIGRRPKRYRVGR